MFKMSLNSSLRNGKQERWIETALANVVMVIFGAYSGQRPYTLKRLRNEQFRKALNSKPPVLIVEASQDKIGMKHYVLLHPDVVPFLKELLKIRKKQGKEKMFEYGSMENQLKRAKIELEHSDLIDNPKERHFVIGDLRKFAEQMADKIKWDVSNKNYILTHGVASVDWSRYKASPSRVRLQDIHGELEGCSFGSKGGL